MYSNYLHSVIIESNAGRSISFINREDGKIEIRNVNNVVIDGRENVGLSSRKERIFELRTSNGKIKEIKHEFTKNFIEYDGMSSTDLIKVIAKATEVLTQRTQKPRIRGYQVGELSSGPGASTAHLENLKNKDFSF